MDVEKTIEFLLQHQAKLAAWQDKVDDTQNRNDRQIRGLLRLARMGAREFLRTDQLIKELGEAQKRTEANLDRLETNLDRFIESLSKQRHDGH